MSRKKVLKSQDEADELVKILANTKSQLHMLIRPYVLTERSFRRSSRCVRRLSKKIEKDAFLLVLVFFSFEHSEPAVALR